LTCIILVEFLGPFYNETCKREWGSCPGIKVIQEDASKWTLMAFDQTMDCEILKR